MGLESPGTCLVPEPVQHDAVEAADQQQGEHVARYEEAHLQRRTRINMYYTYMEYAKGE